MAIRYLAACLAALNLFLLADPASALNVARMTRVINEPVNIQPNHDHVPLSGHSGFSIDTDLSRGPDPSLQNPRSGAYETTMIRWTIAFGGPERPSRECDLTWREHVRVAATAAVFAVSNRLIRGDGDYGGSLPGGATVNGFMIPWMAAAAMHDNLGYGQAAALAALDIIGEQASGWSAALDIGYSAELPDDHFAFNPGNRWQDQAAMTMHLYRAHIGSMSLLNHQLGHVDGSLLAAPAIGGAGYQLGRFLGEEGVTPGWNDESLQGKMFGAKPYRIGEGVAGAAYGIGVGRSLGCAR